MPCPLVHPPAILAPNMMITPPQRREQARPLGIAKRSATRPARFKPEGLLAKTLARLPRNVPTRNNIG